MSPKILTLDIETMANVSFTWGFYEQNVIEILEPWYILMVGYKWAHEKHARVLSLPDYKGFKKNHRDDTELLKETWKLLDEADIVVTQNGDNFDIKKLNVRFLKAGLPPYSPIKSVDTKKTSKRHFSFINNKLDNLGVELGLGGKMHHEGFELWKKCWHGDIKAFKDMAAYCKRDIVLTEKVYLTQRPWMTGHPNINAYTGQENCRVCQSSDIQWRGFNVTTTGKCRRYQCKECGTWGSETKSVRVTTTK